jgi:hypothetical protein
MKYVVVTGGVVSGLGKGVTASSIGVLLKQCGLRVTSIKIDPYLNIDAGTMSPFEHGEVFVLDDGGEVRFWGLGGSGKRGGGCLNPNEKAFVERELLLSLSSAAQLFLRPCADPQSFALTLTHPQVDLDLGNYERFLDITLTRDNNLTTGKVYQVSASEPPSASAPPPCSRRSVFSPIRSPNLSPS